MRHPGLAVWLEEHKETLLALGREGEGFEAPLLEGVLETARTGRVDKLEASAAEIARRAVMQEIPLHRLLRGPRCLKEAMWRLFKQGELSTDQILTLVEAAEPIFTWYTKATALAYVEANQQVQDALAAEIAQLNSEVERRVMNRTADLTKTNIELRKLEQAKTDFISIAAHELKTPLTLIQGYADMLSETGQTDETPGNTHLLKGILRGAERLDAIVENMLDVSAIATNAISLHIEEVSLSNAVSLALSKQAHHFKERKQTVHVGDLTSLPHIEIDSRRLHQILTQLLNNAIKYTPDGGEIYITGQALTGSHPSKRGSTEGGRPATSEFVELILRDTGVGIAPEDRERIFEKFYRVGRSELHSSGQVKFKGAGPGLGLPIARGLAEVHGGRLWAESPGHDEVNCPGSTFHLVLPVHAMPKPEIDVTWVKPPADTSTESKETPNTEQGSSEHENGEE